MQNLEVNEGFSLILQIDNKERTFCFDIMQTFL